MAWLEATGDRAKVTASWLAMPAAYLCYAVMFWALLKRTPAREVIFLVSCALGLAFSIAPLVLNPLVRCRVCGLRMWGSSAARALPRPDRQRWLEGLRACPVCGDDGHATDDSRARWLAAGGDAEAPYWTRRRIALAVLGVLLIGGGGVLFVVLSRG